jgi:hypothetical protein
VPPSTATLWRSSSPTYPWHVLHRPSSLGMQMPRERVEPPPFMMLVPPRSPSTSPFTSFDDAPFDDPWGSSTNSDHHESDAWHVEPEPLSTCHLTLPNIYVRGCTQAAAALPALTYVGARRAQPLGPGPAATVEMAARGRLRCLGPAEILRGRSRFR